VRAIWFLCGGISMLAVVGLLINRALAAARKQAARTDKNKTKPTERN